MISVKRPVAYLVAEAVALMAIKKQSASGTLTEAEASAAAAAGCVGAIK